jgi:alpha-tubulin suppressor-like RCC1 family protein
MTIQLAKIVSASSLTGAGIYLFSNFVPKIEAKNSKNLSNSPQRVWMTGCKLSIPNGCLIDLDRPTPISWFSETSNNWSKIITGPSFGAALASEGLFAWAYDSSAKRYIAPFRIDDQKVIKPSLIQDISCSSSLIFVLTKDGRIHTIDPVSGTRSVLPQPSIDTPSSWWRRKTPVVFKSISVGHSHLLAIDQFGNVWSSGSNDQGQCGVENASKSKRNRFISSGSEDSSTTSPSFNTFHKPYDVSIAGPAVNIAAGGFHSVIATLSNSVFSFGDDSKIQLGLGDTRSQESPDYVPHSGMGNLESANASVKFTETSPSVKYTFYESHHRDKLTRMKIPEKYSDEFTQAFLGSDFTILKSPDSGMMICCGENQYGQCGRGFNKQQQTFASVKLPRDTRPVSISCGSSHCITSLEDGSIYAWGKNTHGQLGTGSRAPVCPPALVHRSKIRGPLKDDIITKIGRGISAEEMGNFLSEQKTDSITVESLLTENSKLLNLTDFQSERKDTLIKTQLLDAIDKSRESHMMSQEEQRGWEPVLVHAGFDNSVIVMKQKI